MPANRPSKAEQTAREVKAWEMAQAHFTQAQIAAELRVDQGTVSRMLERVNRRELRRLSLLVEHFKVRHTEQLERIVSDAARCFERSQRPANRARRSTTRSKGRGPDGEEIETEVEVEQSEAVEQTGNVAYLHVMMSALAQIRAVWGMDRGPADDAQGAGSVAEISRELAERARLYEERRRAKALDAPGPGPGDSAGAPFLPG